MFPAPALLLLFLVMSILTSLAELLQAQIQDCKNQTEAIVRAASSERPCDASSGDFDEFPLEPIGGQTPFSNTGLEVDFGSAVIQKVSSGVSCRIDYLQGTFCNSYKPLEVFDFCISFNDESDIGSDRGVLFSGISWNSHYKTALGCILAVGAERSWLSLPGSFWSSLPPRQAYRVLLRLHRIGFKCTRIDLALDDFKYSLDSHDIYQLIRSDVRVTPRSLRYEISSSYSKEFNREFTTLYLGSKKSYKRYRLYQTLPLHGFDALRYEMQVRDKLAESVFNILASFDYDFSGEDFDDTFPRLISELVTGQIDFRVPESELSYSEWQVQPFWAALKARLSLPLQIVLTRPAVTYRKSLAWVERQVACCLAVIKQCKGDAFVPYLNRVIADGLERFSARHADLVNQGRIYESYG